jgi:ATP-dependent exoDNAse (exonuclease V) alpha subunit
VRSEEGRDIAGSAVLGMHRVPLEMVTNTNATCAVANRRMQSLFNPSSLLAATDKLELPPFPKTKEARLSWVKGDRVVNTQNVNANIGLGRRYNGTMGFISEIDLVKKTFVVTFDDKEKHRYDRFTSGLRHAWCVTTHRYQGSEVRHVVVLFESSALVSCEMIYTAVTRGQQTATLFTTTEILGKGLKLCTNKSRLTHLSTRMSERAASRKREREEDEKKCDEEEEEIEEPAAETEAETDEESVDGSE